jgi:hypothetical protein
MTTTTNPKSIGVLPLARSTFDVEFAKSMAAHAFAQLDASSHIIHGPRELLYDSDSASAALDDFGDRALDLILILQVTFTDASMTVVTAEKFDVPIAIWAIPEPRLGGRLRLNAYCGLNLAAHALGLNRRDFSYLYADPSRAETAVDLASLIAGDRRAIPVETARPRVSANALQKARSVVGRISGRKFARLGEHPDGFHTCTYDAGKLHELIGVEVDNFALDELFARAAGIDDARVAETRARAAADLVGLDDVDQPQLDRSLRLKNALDDIRAEGDYAALAIRCWPETFTEYGGAVCGPVSMMGEQRVPCACEADVFGALTSLLLQEIADAPAFQVDLVDVNRQDGTSVVWHCGQAPISMADSVGRPCATIHTNRKMPLLYEFTLKPGRVTFARLSQARGEVKLMIAGGEVQRQPMAFTGTSGIVVYDAPAEQLEQTIMGAGLEHHSCLVYGDYREELRAVARVLDIPCLEIS